MVYARIPLDVAAHCLDVLLPLAAVWNAVGAWLFSVAGNTIATLMIGRAAAKTGASGAFAVAIIGETGASGAFSVAIIGETGGSATFPVVIIGETGVLGLDRTADLLAVCVCPFEWQRFRIEPLYVVYVAVVRRSIAHWLGCGIGYMGG